MAAPIGTLVPWYQCTATQPVVNAFDLAGSRKLKAESSNPNGQNAALAAGFGE
jgi:hypothetical protein